MRMSEAYATTVAAVAPVIWLVGAVELHQVVQRFAAAATEGEAHDAEYRRRLEAFGDDATWAELRDLTTRFRQTRPNLAAVNTLNRIAHVIWTVTVGCLIAAEVFALGWLGSQPGPQPARAYFCFWALVLGFAAVSYLPLAISIIPTFRIARRHLEHSDTIRDRLTQHRTSIDTRIAALQERVETAQTPEDLQEIRRQIRRLRGEADEPPSPTS
ncbi:hypothetical protein [Streptomyces marianii]|uniref:Uncharacterized protein n=1 Tax=Streptomyces marianii TaxID=1817406 RepID=A0A5R9E971_9ACTN|nr:hypothetical protein [Streptomyces marianii]TLQ45767.1 hypothetical protein FEF34_24710 [Streptomyces marianii]